MSNLAKHTKAHLIALLEAQLAETERIRTESRERITRLIEQRDGLQAQIDGKESSPLQQAASELLEAFWYTAEVVDVTTSGFSPRLTIELPDATAGDMMHVFPGDTWTLLSSDDHTLQAIGSAL